MVPRSRIPRSTSHYSDSLSLSLVFGSSLSIPLASSLLPSSTLYALSPPRPSFFLSLLLFLSAFVVFFLSSSIPFFLSSFLPLKFFLSSFLTLFLSQCLPVSFPPPLQRQRQRERLLQRQRLWQRLWQRQRQRLRSRDRGCCLMMSARSSNDGSGNGDDMMATMNL